MSAASTHDPLVIGVDLGTSSCKATAYDLRGTVVSRGRRGYATHSGADGCMTQRPSDWLAAVGETLAALVAGIGTRPVLGIGLSAQIGTQVLLDGAGAPIGDAITWQDGRAGAVLDELWECVDRVGLARELDTWLPSGAAWPLPRLLWLKRNRPADLAAARYLAQPKDMICQYLTGRLVSDPSSWRGLARPDGSIVHSPLEALGLPNLLPPLVAGSEIAGTLTPEISRLVGLPASTPVYVGWNDLNAGLIGIGAVSPGDAFDIGGTSEHLGVVSQTSGQGFDTVSVPQHGVSTSQYTRYGVSSNGGSVIEWLRAAILGGNHDTSLADLVGSVGPGAGNLLFLPYLQGERAPVWDGAAAGAYVGLRLVHGAGSMVRAALEGVALNLRQIRDSLPGATKWPRIRATGGTAQLTAWNAIKADVLQCSIVTMAEPDSSSLGAAMVAAIGAGVFTSPAAAAEAMVHELATIEPAPEHAGLYDGLYDLYLKLHPALADVSHLLTSKAHHD